MNCASSSLQIVTDWNSNKKMAIFVILFYGVHHPETTSNYVI